VKQPGWRQKSITSGKGYIYMQIAYVDPLLKSWERMKEALFHPFDLRKWFVLGFTAFLAGLTSGNPGGNFSYNFGKRDTNIPDLETLPARVMEWLSAHPVWLLVIMAAIILLMVVALILTWLSCRGAFMFLDNVVHNRAQVVAPWHQFRLQGNSLFLWRAGFGLVCLFLFLPLLVLSFLTFVPILRGHLSPDHLFNFIATVLIGLLLMIGIGYISLFTNNFVVPIMYKYNLKAIAAWQQFMPLLSNHLGYFLLYGLFLVPLAIGVVFAILLGGCMTCCVGFLLLILPYVGSVVLLPVTVAFRAFSLEFLAQWGPEYSLFPVTELPEAGPPAPPPIPIQP
jgi:hypothetical protein